MTTGKRQAIADFEYYSICQGQKEIGPIGYSPLPVNLVEAGFGQIHKLQQADPGRRPHQPRTSSPATTRPSSWASPTPTTWPPSPRCRPACDKTGAGPARPGSLRTASALPRRPRAPIPGSRAHGAASAGAGGCGASGSADDVGRRRGHRCGGEWRPRWVVRAGPRLGFVRCGRSGTGGLVRRRSPVLATHSWLASLALVGAPVPLLAVFVLALRDRRLPDAPATQAEAIDEAARRRRPAWSRSGRRRADRVVCRPGPRRAPGCRATTPLESRRSPRPRPSPGPTSTAKRRPTPGR